MTSFFLLGLRRKNPEGFSLSIYKCIDKTNSYSFSSIKKPSGFGAGQPTAIKKHKLNKSFSFVDLFKIKTAVNWAVSKH
jgi:hypothetical protein